MCESKVFEKDETQIDFTKSEIVFPVGVPEYGCIPGCCLIAIAPVVSFIVFVETSHPHGFFKALAYAAIPPLVAIILAIAFWRLLTPSSCAYVLSVPSRQILRSVRWFGWTRRSTFGSFNDVEAIVLVGNSAIRANPPERCTCPRCLRSGSIHPTLYFRDGRHFRLIEQNIFDLERAQTVGAAIANIVGVRVKPEACRQDSTENEEDGLHPEGETGAGPSVSGGPRYLHNGQFLTLSDRIVSIPSHSFVHSIIKILVISLFGVFLITWAAYLYRWIPVPIACLVLLGIIAGNFNSRYVLDNERGVARYEWSIFDRTVSQTLFDFAAVEAVTVRGRWWVRLPRPSSLSAVAWWEYATVVILSDGRIVAVGPYHSEDIALANHNASALARHLGRRFVRGEAWHVITLDRDPLTGQVIGRQVPSTLWHTHVSAVVALFAIAAALVVGGYFLAHWSGG